MFSKVFINLFLSVSVLVGTTQAQQMSPVLHQKGHGQWKDIVLPKDYVFGNLDKLPKSAEQLSEKAAEAIFQHLRWKPGVQIFGHYSRSYRLYARRGDKTSWITSKNIGYFVEEIDSEAKAFELAMFFRHGVFLTGKADIEALIEGCRSSKVAQVADSTPESFEPTCRFDPKHGAYLVSFYMYEARNVFEAKYLVTPDGLISRSLQNYVIGPVRISGWGLGVIESEEYKRYQKTSEAFEKPIAKPLENIAITVMKNAQLKEKGLAKTREYALDWLLSWGNVKRHLGSIDKFLHAEGTTIDARLKTRALRKLELVRPADPLVLADINLATTTHLAKRKAMITSLIGKFDGKVHKSIKAKAAQTLGQIRAIEAVPDLINYITIPLSEAMSDEVTVDNTFVAVPALINIGKPAATACLDGIASLGPGQESRAKLLLLVVLRVEGEKVTRFLLQDKLENATYEMAANNYKKAIESIEDVKSIGGIK